ncbi:MAG: DUF3800 domain-containing protein [Longimicrobiales bacterium]
MHLFYIDESGNTGARLDSADQPIHWLIALAVTPRGVRAIENEMAAIAHRWLGALSRSADFEFHGSEIFSGRGPHARFSPGQRVAIYDELLSLVMKYACSLFIRGIHKQNHRKRADEHGYVPDHPHRLAFMYLMEQLDEWLEGRQPGRLFETDEEFGLVVADEQKEIDRELVKGFASWRGSGTEHGYRARQIRFLIDTVHYVPSEDSWLIQLTDCVAYIRNRSERVVRTRGFSEASYTKSDKVVRRLWTEHCLPRVVNERVWP